MRNIGEELKAKMTEQKPKVLQNIVDELRKQFLHIIHITDDDDYNYIKPLLLSCGLCVDYFVYGRNIHNTELFRPTLDDILITCQILYQRPRLRRWVTHCLNYLNQQSQLFPWMDEYSIEDGNILVKPKHNKELREGVANLQNNELDNIVRMFYKNGATVTDKEAASASLCKLLEVHREQIKSDLGEVQTNAYFVFANKRYIRHGNEKQIKATENELQIFFDFGLSLVRFIASNQQK